MSEKQASSEIAQSRERFEKALKPWWPNIELSWCSDYSHEPHYDSGITQHWWEVWQMAERDTRERCAQIAKEEADHYQAIEWFETARSFRRVAERIRGKE